MKKYEVRLEFDVISTDLAWIGVEANSKEEALIKAIKAYKESDDNLNLDYYASDHMESTLSESNRADWDVTEILTKSERNT